MLSFRFLLVCCLMNAAVCISTTSADSSVSSDLLLQPSSASDSDLHSNPNSNHGLNFLQLEMKLQSQTQAQLQSQQQMQLQTNATKPHRHSSRHHKHKSHHKHRKSHHSHSSSDDQIMQPEPEVSDTHDADEADDGYRPRFHSSSHRSSSSSSSYASSLAAIESSAEAELASMTEVQFTGLIECHTAAYVLGKAATIINAVAAAVDYVSNWLIAASAKRKMVKFQTKLSDLSSDWDDTLADQFAALRNLIQKSSLSDEDKQQWLTVFDLVPLKMQVDVMEEVKPLWREEIEEDEEGTNFQVAAVTKLVSATASRGIKNQFITDENYKSNVQVRDLIPKLKVSRLFSNEEDKKPTYYTPPLSDASADVSKLSEMESAVEDEFKSKPSDFESLLSDYDGTKQDYRPDLEHFFQPDRMTKSRTGFLNADSQQDSLYDTDGDDGKQKFVVDGNESNGGTKKKQNALVRAWNTVTDKLSGKSNTKQGGLLGGEGDEYTFRQQQHSDKDGDENGDENHEQVESDEGESEFDSDENQNQNYNFISTSEQIQSESSIKSSNSISNSLISQDMISMQVREYEAIVRMRVRSSVLKSAADCLSDAKKKYAQDGGVLEKIATIADLLHVTSFPPIKLAIASVQVIKASWQLFGSIVRIYDTKLLWDDVVAAAEKQTLHTFCSGQQLAIQYYVSLRQYFQSLSESNLKTAASKHIEKGQFGLYATLGSENEKINPLSFLIKKLTGTLSLICWSSNHLGILIKPPIRKNTILTSAFMSSLSRLKTIDEIYSKLETSKFISSTVLDELKLIQKRRLGQPTGKILDKKTLPDKTLYTRFEYDPELVPLPLGPLSLSSHGCPGSQLPNADKWLLNEKNHLLYHNRFADKIKGDMWYDYDVNLCGFKGLVSNVNPALSTNENGIHFPYDKIKATDRLGPPFSVEEQSVTYEPRYTFLTDLELLPVKWSLQEATKIRDITLPSLQEQINEIKDQYKLDVDSGVTDILSKDDQKQLYQLQQLVQLYEYQLSVNSVRKAPIDGSMKCVVRHDMAAEKIITSRKANKKSLYSSSVTQRYSVLHGETTDFFNPQRDCVNFQIAAKKPSGLKESIQNNLSKKYKFLTRGFDQEFFRIPARLYYTESIVDTGALINEILIFHSHEDFRDYRYKRYDALATGEADPYSALIVNEQPLSYLDSRMPEMSLPEITKATYPRLAVIKTFYLPISLALLLSDSTIANAFQMAFQTRENIREQYKSHNTLKSLIKATDAANKNIERRNPYILIGDLTAGKWAKLEPAKEAKVEFVTPTKYTGI